jgi:two-component system, cell cycle response regulator
MGQRTERIAMAVFGVAIAWAIVQNGAVLVIGDVGLRGELSRWTHLGPMVLAVGLCVAGGARRGPERASWWLVAAGIACWTLADIWYAAFYWIDGEPSGPAVSDVGYLLAPMALSASVVNLWRQRGSSGPTELRLDGVAAALAVTAISCMLVIEPVVRGYAGASTAAAIVHAAYPLLDIVVIGTVVAALASSGWRPNGSWMLLGCGVFAFWVSDSHYLVASAEGTYVAGDPFDAGWYVGMVLMAAASWVRGGSERRPSGGVRALTTVMPVAVAGLNLAVLVAALGAPSHVVAAAFACAGLVTGLVRLGLTLAAHERLIARTEAAACTDPLTGLPNRRALERDLATACDRASNGEPAALAYFDLDGFKQFNDTFGHAAGDDLLARLGRSLVADLARHGAAYRLGGDEFCVLFQSEVVRTGGLAGAIERASAALTDQVGDVVVTSSCGWIAMPGEAAEPEVALALADTRMYECKRAARAGRVA